MNDPSVAKPPERYQAGQSRFYELATRNTAATLSASAIAVVFLGVVGVYGYLNVFDASLISVVDYSDIAKLVLIPLALIATGFIGIVKAAKLIGIWVRQKPGWQNSARLFLGLAFGIASIQIVIMERKASPDILFFFNFWLLVLFAVALMWRTYTFVIEKGRSLEAVGVIICSLVFVAYFAGYVVGVSVRDGAPADRIIATRDREYQHSKVILFLSRHLVSESDGKIFIVPASKVRSLTRE
jgi:hypothetical protein